MSESPDFGFESLEINNKTTARYIIYAVKGEPYVDVMPALETTRDYYNAVLRRTKKNMRRRMSAITATQLGEQRDEDRELFAAHIIKGWNFKDRAGNAIPFSQKNVHAMLKALPDWLFDEMRTWCGDANNFLKQTDMTEEEVVETGEH